MVIDGHAHASGPFYRPETLLGTLDELGVDKVALCQNVRASGREVRLPFEKGEITRHPAVPFVGNVFLRQGGRILGAEKDRTSRNRDVLDLAGKCRGRVIPFHWANPARPDALEEIATAVERDGFRGIKLHQCVNPFPIDSSVMREISAFAAEKSVPVFIHFYSPGEVRKFPALARAHPGTTFIVAHLIGIEILVRHATELRNIYWDMSPAWGSPVPRLRFAVDTFGADRVMLGSDTPFGRNTLRRNIAKIRGMDLPNAAKDLILGGNAARLY
jgi:predicted TIM-barrel fold metal-dependent hydrolase